MKTHYEIVQDLLEFASSNNNNNEFERISKYIEDMHLKCINKDINSCAPPCTRQKTDKRGQFCVYKPGEFQNIPNDILKQIKTLNLIKHCANLFFRIHRPQDNYVQTDIYIPLLISDNYLFWNGILANFKSVFRYFYDSHNITGINAVLKDRPSTRTIDIDINTANDVYYVLTGISQITDIVLLKQRILNALYIWANRFQFTTEEIVDEIHVLYGTLTSVRMCKNFDNFKATHKLAAEL